LIYPTKEEHIVKKLGDRWEMLGISLADIMEVELGKRKKSTGKPEEKFELDGGEEPFQ